MNQKLLLSVERLEDRSVPAGTVTISGWGAGNLNVVGDAQGNEIEIIGSSNSIQINAQGTTTLSLGTIPAAWVVSSSPTQVVLQPTTTPLLGQLVLDLKAGDDQVGVFGLQGLVQANGNILIMPGDGNDTVRLGGDATAKALLIRDNLGNDVVQLDAVSARDPSQISLGAGNDSILIAGTGTIFDSDLTLLTGAGSDRIRFVPGQSWIKGNLSIDTSAAMGDGGDSVLVDHAASATAPHTLRVSGSTTIKTGNGADLIRFGSGSGTGPSVDLGGGSNPTTIEMGNDNDRIGIQRAQFAQLTVNLGNGTDQVLNNWGSASMLVAAGSVLDFGPPNPPLGSDSPLPSGWTSPPGLTVFNHP
ncbi:MAG: hypothetical protein RMI91_02515 [Gemmatales bacterium]|nr:hypothetical protein [Gemmatales bacterium]MDW7993500.1 hypothetical protein [Gemmatales bacterium]